MTQYELRNVAESCNHIPYAEYVDNYILNAKTKEEAIEETLMLQEAHDADYISTSGMVLEGDILPVYLDCLYFVDRRNNIVEKVTAD